MLFELQDEILLQILSYSSSLDQLYFILVCKKFHVIFNQLIAQQENEKNNKLRDAAKKLHLSRCWRSIFINKADVNSVDAIGNTALHLLLASSPYETKKEENRLHICIYLLWHKVYFLKKNKANVTALDLAIGYGYLDIIKILIALFLTRTQADTHKLKLALKEQINSKYGYFNLHMGEHEIFYGRKELNSFLETPLSQMTPLFNQHLAKTQERLKEKITQTRQKLRR